MLTVSRPTCGTWITLSKIYVTIFNFKAFTKMYVCHTKNVCKSQNSMKLFFLYSHLINAVFLLVPPAVLVIIDDPSNFQYFLGFLKSIYNPFQKVTKVTKSDVCKSQNMTKKKLLPEGLHRGGISHITVCYQRCSPIQLISNSTIHLLLLEEGLTHV